MFRLARYHVQGNTIPNKHYQFVHLKISLWIIKQNLLLKQHTSLTNMDTDTFTLHTQKWYSIKISRKAMHAPWFFNILCLIYLLYPIDNTNTLFYRRCRCFMYIFSPSLPLSALLRLHFSALFAYIYFAWLLLYNCISMLLFIHRRSFSRLAFFLYPLRSDELAGKKENFISLI